MREISLVVGDAIHNLRTSLDYAWCGAVEAINLGAGPYTKFPFRKCREELENVLRGAKIDVASPNLFKGIISEVKPYPGGNDRLFALHDIDIADKHKLLIPVVNCALGRGMSVEDQHGTVFTGDSWAWYGGSARYFDFAPEIKIKNKGEASVTILFSEAESTTLAGASVPRELRWLTHLTIGAIETIEKLSFKTAVGLSLGTIFSSLLVVRDAEFEERIENRSEP